MRKLLIFVAVLFALTSYSQRIRGFGGAAIYRDVQFNGSGFANLAVGAEYKINQIVRPEVEASVFYGSLEERTNTNSEGILTSYLDRSFTATNISICAKICIGDKANETGQGFFQILPLYSITKVMAKGRLVTVNQKDVSKSTTETENYTDIRHSLGIGIGLYAYTSKKYNNSLALNLYYNGINFGNSISNLKFSSGASYQTDVFGLGLKYYFAFMKKNEKK